MSVPLAYLNGDFVPFGQFALSAADAGFVFGATVTDLVRTFRHQPFRLDDHLARFRSSCRLCRVPLPVGDDELRAAAQRLIEHNAALLPSHGELAVVMFATPGPIGYYAGRSGTGPATLGMHTFPLPFSRYRALFTDGATLVVPPTRHVPAASVNPRAKMRSRMVWWIAEQEAKEIEPGASALLLDADGHVTETAAANFLIVRGGTVISPPRGTVLDGVSLRVVRELCGELGIPVVEQPLTLAECQAGDEALLAGTAFCVAGVRRLDGVELVWPGPVLDRLLRAWSQLVGLDIQAQFTKAE